jgi:hypothetical protein
MPSRRGGPLPSRTPSGTGRLNAARTLWGMRCLLFCVLSLTGPREPLAGPLHRTIHRDVLLRRRWPLAEWESTPRATQRASDIRKEPASRICHDERGDARLYITIVAVHRFSTSSRCIDSVLPRRPIRL